MLLLPNRPGRATARFFTAFHDLIQPQACVQHRRNSTGLNRRTASGLSHPEQYILGRRPTLQPGNAVKRRNNVAAAAGQVSERENGSDSRTTEAGDTNAYKAFMRSVSSPVAVVTARKTLTREAESKYADCIGATISSLTSVCIKPSPVLSFNLHEKSGTATSIADSKDLTVHILTGDRTGESIANSFANPAKRHWYEPFQTVAKLDGHKVEFDGAGHVVISGPGVLARAHCNLIGGKTVNVGDHLVMFANVLGTALAEATATQGRIGLSFAQGVYQRSSPLDEAPQLDLDDSSPSDKSAPAPPQHTRSAHLPRNQRHYSTSTSTSPDAAPEPTEEKPFLKQTVRDYLSLSTMPKHRWRNQRALAELDGYGRERVALAIAGGNSDAPPGSQPGGQTNHVDARIRTLIERLHVANKLGHVPDEVMEQLVLGPKEER